jgi:DNA-binding transcriptional MerR regulator
MPAPIDSAAAGPLQAVPGNQELYAIREVSRLTGVTAVTLRAWERRHRLIVPLRTESGRRLYSMSDIERIRQILGWIDRGVAVGRIGTLLAHPTQQQANSQALPDQQADADYIQWQQQVQSAACAFDDVGLGLIYGRIFSAYPQAIAFQNILMPAWKQMLQRQDHFGGSSEWLYLDGFLRARVLHRLMLTRGTERRRVIVCGLAGQFRELELLVAALFLSAGQTGVRVLNIGQPFDELPLVCERIRPEVLILFSNHLPDAGLPERLKRLASSLKCQLLLAGDAADLAQEGLDGSSVGCLGNEAQVMHERLLECLAGKLEA